MSLAVLIINIHRSRAMKKMSFLIRIFYIKNANENGIFLLDSDVPGFKTRARDGF